MDYHQMNAPCGLDCFNCVDYLANESEEAKGRLERDMRINRVPVALMVCQECRNKQGVLESHKHFFNRSGPCYVYRYTREKNISFCYECAEFPCDYLHPTRTGRPKYRTIRNCSTCA